MRKLSIALVVVLAAACGKNEKPPPARQVALEQESGPAGKQPASPDAQAFFAQTCALCHGPDGTGNGPAAATLNPKPRNYTDANWQASITDEEIKQIILLGGQGVGKSISMPPNPGLKDNPALLDGLVKIIRGFGKK